MDSEILRDDKLPCENSTDNPLVFEDVIQDDLDRTLAPALLVDTQNDREKRARA